MIESMLARIFPFFGPVYGLFVFALAVSLSGCPHPNPPPAPPPDLSVVTAAPACSSSPRITPKDNCLGMFTKEKIPLQCVRCGAAAQGCFYPPPMGVYCVAGSCTSDPLCEYHQPTNPTEFDSSSSGTKGLLSKPTDASPHKP